MSHRRTAVLQLVALALLIGAGDARADTVSNACGTATVQQSFGFAGDTRLYAPAPDGTFEKGAAGWTRTGGTAVASGNDTLPVVGGAGKSSLRLPAAGASATSPTLCLAKGMADFRFAVRNTGAASSTLKVEILVSNGSGKTKDSKTQLAATISAGATWTSPAPYSVTTVSLNGNGVTRSIAYRFTVVGAGNWQIDDLFVDPIRRS